MMTLNQYMATLVKQHGVALQDGCGDLPVIFLRGSGGKLYIHRWAEDPTTAWRVSDADSIRDWIIDSDVFSENDIPDWLKTYQGEVMIVYGVFPEKY